MKHMIKRIIVGIIIGLVLMLARKYLYINASAATKEQQSFNINSFDDKGVFGMDSNTTYSNAYWKSLDGGYAYLTWSISNVSPDKANAYFFFSSFNYNYDYAYFTIYQNLATNTSGSCSTLSTQRSTLPIAKLGNVPCEVVYTRNDDNYGQRASYKCPITNSNHLSFFYPQNMGTICSSEWGIQNFILYYKGNESAIIDSIDNGSQAVSDSVNDLNDSINDDTIGTDTDNDISNLQNTDVSSAEDAGIEDLITLPIELFTGFISALNGSCSPYRIGNLLGTDITLPCFNMGSVLGSVWNIIDIVISSVIFFKFATKLKEIFINLTSLNENKGDLIE